MFCAVCRDAEQHSALSRGTTAQQRHNSLNAHAHSSTHSEAEVEVLTAAEEKLSHCKCRGWRAQGEGAPSSAMSSCMLFGEHGHSTGELIAHFLACMGLGLQCSSMSHSHHRMGSNKCWSWLRSLLHRTFCEGHQMPRTTAPTSQHRRLRRCHLLSRSTQHTIDKPLTRDGPVSLTLDEACHMCMARNLIVCVRALPALCAPNECQQQQQQQACRAGAFAAWMRQHACGSSVKAQGSSQQARCTVPLPHRRLLAFGSASALPMRAHHTGAATQLSDSSKG